MTETKSCAGRMRDLLLRRWWWGACACVSDILVPVHDSHCSEVCFRDEAVWMHIKVQKHSRVLSPVSAVLGKQTPALLISVNTCSVLKVRGREPGILRRAQNLLFQTEGSWVYLLHFCFSWGTFPSVSCSPQGSCSQETSALALQEAAADPTVGQTLCPMVGALLKPISGTSSHVPPSTCFLIRTQPCLYYIP